MKRIWKWSLCLCLMLCLLIAPGVRAVALGGFSDNAFLVDASDALELDLRAQSLSQEYQCGIYIITVDDYRDYAATPAATTEWFFEEYDLGWGEDRDGILLMLSMAERDYDLYVHGSVDGTAFTEYGLDEMESNFLWEFKYNNWRDGFEAYLNDCEKFLSMYAQGRPFDASTDVAGILTVVVAQLGISLVISCVIAAVVCLVFLVKMHSVHKGTDARAYAVEGSQTMRVQEDQFTHTTEVRRRVERSSSSGGGRSSGGGGGGSHRSGKF